MTTTTPIDMNPTRMEFLRALQGLLPQVTFSGDKGSYVEGETICVLVEPRPSEGADTFDAGMTIFPLGDDPIDLTGIDIILTGQVEGKPQVRPLRRGTTNRRGNLTVKGLPRGRYRLLPGQRVLVTHDEPPIFRAAANWGDQPPAPLVFASFTNEEQTLTCTLRETAAGEVLLHIDAAPANSPVVQLDFAVVDKTTDQVVTYEREQETKALAGSITLQREADGQFHACESLGYGIVFPEHWELRVWPSLGTEPE